VGPLSIQDRTVVRPEIVSELRSRNTDHLDSREITDIECRALAMLREHSMLHPARNSRKSNKNKPCRRDGHDTRTETSPETSPNPTDDRLSSDDGPDSSDPDTSARGMDVEQTVSPGRCITLNRRSTRLSMAREKEEARDPHAGKEDGGNKFCDIIIASTICLTMNVSSSVPLLRACMIQHTFSGAIKFTLGSRVSL